MKWKPGSGGKALAAALTVGVATAAYAQARLSLTVNGTVASSEVRMIGGRPFVPLSDVARAYNQTLVKRSGGYELIAAGGAGEVGDNHTGKIGSDLFTGQFKFKVLSVQNVQTYTERWDQARTTLTPNTGDTLYVVNCRIKNGTPQKQTLVFSLDSTQGNPNTALTDDQEHSYVPYNYHGGTFFGYDVHQDEHYPDGADILPGAALDFAIVFSVPSETHPKDVIFSILKYGDRTRAKAKSVDVRVSLAP